MAFKFNPFTGKLDIVVDDHSKLSNLPWSTAGHTIDTNVDFAGYNANNVGTLGINATSDHTIVSSSDVLKITNPNSSKGIVFNANNGSISNDHFFFNEGGNGSFAIKPPSSFAPSGLFSGFINVAGTWDVGAVFSALRFSPVMARSTQFIAFYVDPQLLGGAIGFRYTPTLLSGITSTSTHTMFEFSPTAPIEGKTTTFTIFSDSIPRTAPAYTGLGNTSVTIDGIKIGGTATALGFTGNATVVDTHIKLTGGISEFGTGGVATVTQRGITFTGYGAAQPTNGSIRAIEANGGWFSHKYNYVASKNTMTFGLGEDSAIGYDGIDFIINTSLVNPSDLVLSCGTNKTLELGHAVYDDWQGSLSSNQKVNPSAHIADNTAEASVTFKTNCNTGDYVYMNPQMQHAWKLGSNIYPHLHWWQTTSAQPNWLVQYRWQRNGQAKTTSWTNYPMTTNSFTYTSGTLNQITYGAAITPPTGYSISDIIQFRLIRDVANTSGSFAGAESSSVDADATSFDYHYQIDTLGSRQEYAK